MRHTTKYAEILEGHPISRVAKPIAGTIEHAIEHGKWCARLGKKLDRHSCEQFGDDWSKAAAKACTAAGGQPW